MKKVIMSVVFVLSSSVAVGSQVSVDSNDQGHHVVSKPVQRPFVSRCTSFVQNNPLVSSVATFTALHVAQNGRTCPLTQKAQKPALLVGSAALTYKAWQSENRVVKFGVTAISAAVAGVTVLDMVKNK